MNINVGQLIMTNKCMISFTENSCTDTLNLFQGPCLKHLGSMGSWINGGSMGSETIGSMGSETIDCCGMKGK